MDDVNRDRIASTESFGSAGDYPIIATLPRHDVRDRRDKKHGDQATYPGWGMQNQYGGNEDGKVVSLPNVNEADRYDRPSSPDSIKTADYSGGEYDARSTEGGMPISYLKRPPSNKDEKKREKEQKKREEEERKRREKEEKERKKKGINDKLSNSEDRLGKMTDDDSVIRADAVKPVAADLETSNNLKNGQKPQEEPEVAAEKEKPSVNGELYPSAVPLTDACKCPEGKSYGLPEAPLDKGMVRMVWHTVLRQIVWSKWTTVRTRQKILCS
ncbi:glutamic acid-rich protein-like [Octopus sinensis]|uniref:Glutamic acid-rich protein-like n=1 Tax=Octopus sinensis TaxID=2607531 RepID=A0A7E6EL02_9MOLL|nr:glutamic acid-rich protein-like [Octopus sinensis]